MNETTNHTKDNFLDWLEGNLSKENKKTVERHLEQCEPCRSYFRSMEQMLSKSNTDQLPTLEKDPYLPARIKHNHVNQDCKKWVPVLGLSSIKMGVLTVFTLISGVLLGQLLVYNSSQQAEQATIGELYYESIFQPGLGSNFEQFLLEMEGDQQ